MGKLGKLFLWCGVGLLLLGGISAAVGWSMGAETSLTFTFHGNTVEISPFGLSSREPSAPRGERAGGWDPANSAEVELAEVQRLDVDLEVADLTVECGAQGALSLDWYGEDYRLEYALEDGCLQVWSEREKTVSPNDFGATVVLTIPEGTVLTKADFTVDVGSLSLTGVELAQLDLDCGVGEVSLVDLSLERAELRLDVGDLYVELTHLGERLSAASEVGDIGIYGAAEGDLELSSSVGDVTVGLDAPKNAYAWALNSGAGSIYLDGEEAEWGGETQGGSGARTLEAVTGVGDINVEFSGTGS